MAEKSGSAWSGGGQRLRFIVTRPTARCLFVYRLDSVTRVRARIGIVGVPGMSRIGWQEGETSGGMLLR